MKTCNSLITALLAFVLFACNHPTVSLEQEKKLVDAIFLSLEATPEQFADVMDKQALHPAGHYDFPTYTYDSYTNVNLQSDYNYTDQLLVGITHTNDVINRIEYSRYLNDESNVAAYYKIFSDMIAIKGYSNWNGYYCDPANEDDVHGAMSDHFNDNASTAKNRNELCESIRNENLKNIDSLQYFAETFIYLDTNNKQWKGKILLYSNKYFSGEDEDSGDVTKDILFSFSLSRIVD